MSNYEHKIIMTKTGALVLPRIDDLTELSGSEPDTRAESATQLFPIGAALITDDGVYRYCKNGGVAITIGKLCQMSAAQGSDHDNDLAVAAAAAAGDTSVTITNGASTAITANMYKDGYLFINDANGEGGLYKIKSHPAAATTASCVLTLVDALEVALTTSSECGLRKNPYDAIVVNPTSPTGAPIGVAQVSSLTASYYGWIKTKGIANVLTNGTLVLGNHCCASLTTAGAVDPFDNDGSTNYNIVGTVMCVAASTEYSLVKIDLDQSW